MSLFSFLESLLTDGRVLVAAVANSAGDAIPISTSDVEDGTDFLLNFEKLYRCDLPCTAPHIDTGAVRWGAITLFRACSLLSHRDADAATVSRMMSDTFQGESRTPSIHYSIDLTLRFLPDVMRYARAASPDDPLVHELKRISCEWPLSSVGIEDIDIDDVSLNGILESDCLEKLYVDRILSTDDASRLSNPIIAQSVRAAIGIHSQLAGSKVAARLNKDDAVVFD